MEIYYHAAMEARNPQSRHWQSYTLSKGYTYLFQLLLAVSTPRLVDEWLISASIFTWSVPHVCLSHFPFSSNDTGYWKRTERKGKGTLFSFKRIA
jgi:hypothetical protein